MGRKAAGPESLLMKVLTQSREKKGPLRTLVDKRTPSESTIYAGWSE